jgi:hypothetical protein
VQSLLLLETNIVRRAAPLALWFAVASGCSSSDKTPATTPPPADGGAKEAAVKYLACDAPQDLLSSVTNAATGYVICANSNNALALHRPQIQECASALPRATTCIGIGSGTDSGVQSGLCRSDADCTGGLEGHCDLASGACVCHYGCKSDADCEADRICVCGSPTGQCVLAQCKSDADCGAGSLCLSSSDGACRRKFACQNPKDTCAGDKDCPARLSQCTIQGDQRVCKEPPNCGVGQL